MINMRKVTVTAILALIFLSSFVFAAQQLTVSDDSYNIQTPGGNINVQQDGNTVTMTTPNGTVRVEGQGENQRIMVTTADGQEINVDVSAVAEKVQIKSSLGITTTDIEQLRNGGKTSVQVTLSNGKNAEVKILPETASAKAIANMKAKCEVNSCTVELKEVGSGDETKVQYEVKTKKKAKVLGFIGTDMSVSADVDAESGKVIKVHKPWWSFLASEEDVSVSISA